MSEDQRYSRLHLSLEEQKTARGDIFVNMGDKKIQGVTNDGTSVETERSRTGDHGNRVVLEADGENMEKCTEWGTDTFWPREQRTCVENVGEEDGSKRRKQLSGFPVAGLGIFKNVELVTLAV